MAKARVPNHPFSTMAIGEHFEVPAFEPLNASRGYYSTPERRLKAALRMYRLRNAPTSEWHVSSPEYGTLRATRTS